MPPGRSTRRISITSLTCLSSRETPALGQPCGWTRRTADVYANAWISGGVADIRRRHGLGRAQPTSRADCRHIARTSRLDRRAIGPGQLGISYRGRSWLCVDDGSQGEPRAGGPRAGRSGWQGTPVRGVPSDVLHAAGLFGKMHTGALPPDLPPELNVVAINEWTDPGLSVTERYSAKGGELVLVRPDGNIGFRGCAHSHAALRAYLDRVTLPGSKA
jgi:hypothetical protein